MQGGVAGADAARPVEVVIDLGLPGGRTGCRTLAQAEAVARAVRAADRLRLAGAGGVEGALAPYRSAASPDPVPGYLRSPRQRGLRLGGAGRLHQAAQIRATAWPRRCIRPCG